MFPSTLSSFPFLSEEKYPCSMMLGAHVHCTSYVYCELIANWTWNGFFSTMTCFTPLFHKGRICDVHGQQSCCHFSHLTFGSLQFLKKCMGHLSKAPFTQTISTLQGSSPLGLSLLRTKPATVRAVAKNPTSSYHCGVLCCY